ncbi:class I SAM-dependent methyltransferase [uncultured Desulfosarcina sp.]|uniref:class I SAM-dependent methyltransferase n=1 Tax=uncultured Desulfosarcina sp. TaxID=218289 RepID=UPI0029C766EB|nr:class I SAM-dependent methyltransferase [uncultured Desulfosarcina sp.]
MIRYSYCPNCNKNHVEGFFRIDNAPIFSVVTLKTREEALAVPRKDIELAFCNDCGFIFNRLYDTSIDYFSMGYEDQQGHSKTFMQYLTRISHHLIGRYNIKNQTIVEIGCGKGDFLNLINTLSGGVGIGIDPAYADGRQENPNLTFYKEQYSLKHGEIASRLVCCRHTLEHIHQTKAFMTLIRDSFGSVHRPLIFFEVPQISRILDDFAFWDIYYEHCSYFSAGSLARLFRSTGFKILDLRFDYDDQYLLIEAVAAEETTPVTFDIEESIAEQKQRVDAFRMKINEQLGFWRNRLQEIKDQGKRAMVWGGGSKAVGFLTNFADIGLFEFVVDINPYMENNFIPGIGSQYVQPGFLKEYQPDVVIIMNGIYKDEISQTMNEMGVFPNVYTL